MRSWGDPSGHPMRSHLRKGEQVNAFRTVDGTSEAEHEEKGSRFLSYLTHVTSEEEAIAFRRSIREAIPEASHYVSAYIIDEGNVMRYSDAKEPHGTAGMPVFTVIEKLGLRDVVCVVARIFGGTLLGRGGLMRAYTKAAQMACDNARFVRKAPCRDVLVSVPYPLYESVSKRLGDMEGVTVTGTSFADDVTMELLVLSEHVEAVCESISDICCGAAEIVTGDEQLRLVGE